jgi:hypothetical protein
VPHGATVLSKDRYEDALKELLRKKQKGEKIERVKEPTRTNVVNLMGASRKSVAEEKKLATKTKKGRKRIADQREMLLPISGDRGKETVLSLEVAMRDGTFKNARFPKHKKPKPPPPRPPRPPPPSPQPGRHCTKGIAGRGA